MAQHVGLSVLSLREEVPNPALTVHDLHESAARFIARGRKDPWERADENLSHLLGLHPLGRMEDEASRAKPNDGDLFAGLSSDLFVLREDDPSPPSGLSQPDLVVVSCGKTSSCAMTLGCT